MISLSVTKPPLLFPMLPMLPPPIMFVFMGMGGMLLGMLCYMYLSFMVWGNQPNSSSENQGFVKFVFSKFEFLIPLGFLRNSVFFDSHFLHNIHLKDGQSWFICYSCNFFWCCVLELFVVHIVCFSLYNLLSPLLLLERVLL